jgi:tryptophan synthase beta chain
MLNKFLNLKAYHQSDLFDPLKEREIGLDDLSRVFPPSLAELELSKEKYIDIPKEISDIYSTYRPTPLFRAKEFEKTINTNCEIYIKNEGVAPTGNHKANSAYLIAYLCRKDGVKTIATETTGNWGLALAMAGKEFGVKVACFLDYESHIERPNRKSLIERLGAHVIIVEPHDNQKVKDLLTLSADAAIKFTKESQGVYYIFGSVYSYFIIPQSIIGLEIKSQLKGLNKYPDIVIGACGGGANLLGTAATFLADIVDEKRSTRIVSAEAESCPILSEGKMGLYSIDSLKYFPLLRTYGIDELKEDKYIGGLGATIVASSVAFFHSKGIIEANRFTPEEAKNAARLFYKSEGILIALETGYTMAAIIKQAQENDHKVIVANISSGDTDKRFYE